MKVNLFQRIRTTVAVSVALGALIFTPDIGIRHIDTAFANDPCQGLHSWWTYSKSSTTTYSARAWITATNNSNFCSPGTLSSSNSMSVWSAVQGSGTVAPGQIVQSGLLQEVLNGTPQALQQYYWAEYHDAGIVSDTWDSEEFGTAPTGNNSVYSQAYQPHYWCGQDNAGCGAFVLYRNSTQLLTTPWDPAQDWSPPWKPEWSGEVKDYGDDLPGTDPRGGGTPTKFTTEEIDAKWNDWSNYSVPSSASFSTGNGVPNKFRIDNVSTGNYNMYTCLLKNANGQC